MSKYIIDTETWSNLFEAKKVGIYGIGIDLLTNEKTVWSRMFHLDELEELNSDYINEHSRELQDEAYQKGFEDGKKSTEKGCEGCAYETARNGTYVMCSNNYRNLWEKRDDTKDHIEVGDIVDRYIDGNFDSRGIYLGGNGEIWNCLFWANTLPITLAFPKEQFKKTGKHYDVQSILEAMKQ